MAHYDQSSQEDGNWPEEYSGNTTEGSVTQVKLSGAWHKAWVPLCYVLIVAAPYTTSFITAWVLLQSSAICAPSGTREHRKELSWSCNFSPEIPASPHLSDSQVELKEKPSPSQKSLGHCFRLLCSTAAAQ